MADEADSQLDAAAPQQGHDDGADPFRRLLEIATKLNSTLNLDDLLQLIMRSAAELLGAETSSLLLLDETTNELVFEVVAGGPAADLAKRRIPSGEGIAGWALSQRVPVTIDSPSSDSRFYREIEETTAFETRNLVAVPLLARDRAIGVIEVLNKGGGGGFTPSDLEVAGALASLAAIAIDNASMYSRLADAVVTARLSYRL